MFFSREVLVALVVGFVLVTGSFYVSASNETVAGDISVIAKPPTREYIPINDANNNGISDWAEELLDERETIVDDIDPVEAYVPPSTLTGRFSIEFFQDYLYAKGFGENIVGTKEELAERAVAELKREATDVVYTIDDVIIDTDDSTEAIRRYGNRIAEITTEYSNPVTENLSETDILERAINTDNPERLKDLDPIIDAYRGYFEATKATPVPPKLVRQHVDLINVYNAVLTDLIAMRYTFEDPLLALLRTKRYEEDIAGLIYVYYNIDRVLRREGITYEEDEPAYVMGALGVLRELIQQQQR